MVDGSNAGITRTWNEWYGTESVTV